MGAATMEDSVLASTTTDEGMRLKVVDPASRRR